MTRLLRPLAIALLASAVLLAFAVSGLHSAPVARADGAQQLLVVGDSLAYGTARSIRNQLSGWKVTTRAQVGRPTPVGMRVLRDSAKRGLPKHVIISLGTNDWPSTTDPFRKAIREASRLVGPKRCLYWINISRPNYGGESWAVFNEVLAEEQRRLDNLVVINWRDKVRDGDVPMQPDRVHPTAAGYGIRAKMMAKAVRDGC